MKKEFETLKEQKGAISSELSNFESKMLSEQQFPKKQA